MEKSILEDVPEPGPGQEVVRVVGAIGGNLLKIETANHEEHLCRLPQRFSKVVFVKRGSLLIATGCDADYKTASGQTGKVKFLCDHVLFSEQVRHLQVMNLLPEAFQSPKAAVPVSPSSDLYLEDLGMNRNKNRREEIAEGDDSSEDESES